MAVKGLALALPLPKGEREEEGSDDELRAGDMGRKAAAEDIIDAVKSGDAKALVAALKDFLDLNDDSFGADEDTDDDI